MDEGGIGEIEDPTQRRSAGQELVGRYHEAQLRSLLERVREGFRGSMRVRSMHSTWMTSSTTTSVRPRSSGAFATGGPEQNTQPVPSNGTENTTSKAQTGGNSAGRAADEARAGAARVSGQGAAER